MRKELRIKNQVSELEKVAQFVEEIGEELGLNMELQMNLNLVMEEMVSNVIFYAYPEGEKGMVEITLGTKEGQIQTCISDTGTPFNPLQHPEAELSSSIEERPIGGLGIHLIKEIMDNVEYQYKDGRNMLTMTLNV